MVPLYDINKEIIAKADKCDKNYACLYEPDGLSCTILSCLNGKIHFVNKLERMCPYHLEFGYSHLCGCPVRKEIYDKYGK